MRVDQLFTIAYGHSMEYNRQTVNLGPTGINFVSRTDRNNGVSGRVERVEGIEPAPAGTLSVALGGSVLATFVQPEPYYCGRDVSVLTPIQPMTTKERLWWAMCIRANRYRYSYGRQANRTLKSLELPDLVPEWVNEDYPVNVSLSVDTQEWRISTVAD